MKALLETALNLLTPGVWGREHGYDVPSGEGHDWEVERIRLMRAAGRNDVAEHLTKDKLELLEASDGKARADAFRAALEAVAVAPAPEHEEEHFQAVARAALPRARREGDA